MKILLTLAFLSTLLSLSVQNSVSINYGEEKVAVKGNLSAHRSPPEDYQYISGVGYYKFEDQWETFENAQLICEKSGAHLAIINSQDEAYALVDVFLPYFKPGLGWPRLGFWDFLHKGDFQTIFGESLESTGYSSWARGEPVISYERNCGCMDIEGLLGAQCCDCNRWFICEFE